MLQILQKDLHLHHIPEVIECFDNSNIMGTTPVASLVRFVGGKPDKKGYRHFNIRTVEGANDFASMKEIVGRRYKRVIEEGEKMPDLIVVDGGKGQLSGACEALKELNIYGQVPIIGIAKKLEEIYYPDDSLPLHISKKSPGLMLIQQIRDEAHRFAITFHRLKRSKGQLKTEIQGLEGIGEKTAFKLLKHFKTVRRLKRRALKKLKRSWGKRRRRSLKGSFKRQAVVDRAPVLAQVFKLVSTTLQSSDCSSRSRPAHKIIDSESVSSAILPLIAIARKCKSNARLVLVHRTARWAAVGRLQRSKHKSEDLR